MASIPPTSCTPRIPSIKHQAAPTLVQDAGSTYTTQRITRSGTSTQRWAGQERQTKTGKKRTGVSRSGTRGGDARHLRRTKSELRLAGHRGSNSFICNSVTAMHASRLSPRLSSMRTLRVRLRSAAPNTSRSPGRASPGATMNPSSTCSLFLSPAPDP